MRAYLLIAFHNLLQARRRTLLLGLSLALVTMLLIVLGAVSQGFSTTLRDNATSLASGHVNVAGWYKSKQTDAWPLIAKPAEIEALVRAKVPGLAAVVRRERAWAKAIARNHSFYVSPSGIDITNETRLADVLRLARENEYMDGGRDAVVGSLDRLKEPNSALIFAAQARRLEVGVGDYLTLTAPTGSGRTNTIDVTVVAVAKDLGFMSNWALFVPNRTVHELYETSPEATSVLMLYLEDPSRAEQVMGDLRTALVAGGHDVMEHDPQAFFMKFEAVAGEDWTGQKLDLTAWTDEVSYISWVSTVLDTVTAILVGILMSIIAIGIMNAMWMSVGRRTAEIGTARAIGMTRSGVLAMFMSEALMLGLVGSSFGALSGVLLASGLDAMALAVPSQALEALLMSDTLHFDVSAGQVVNAIVLFTLITGLAAISPAITASRLQPVTAIHHAT